MGCPYTPPNCYWKFLRTLYGLRRSPRHWFDKAKLIFEKIGLTQCPNAPCIFHGTSLPGKAPIYLGVYVDDIIYFSTNDDVEREFETRLNNQTKTDFMRKVSHFLGLKFQWNVTPDKVSVHLSQEAFTDRLLYANDLISDSTSAKSAPFRSGAPIDSTKDVYLPPEKRQSLKKNFNILWVHSYGSPQLPDPILLL